MTKAEIKTQMEAAGVLKMSGSKHNLWVEAFKLYNAGKQQQLRMGCGSCYNKVREWLQS
jgi:hypothetical protein